MSNTADREIIKRLRADLKLATLWTGKFIADGHAPEDVLDRARRSLDRFNTTLAETAARKVVDAT